MKRKINKSLSVVGVLLALLGCVTQDSNVPLGANANTQQSENISANHERFLAGAIAAHNRFAPSVPATEARGARVTGFGIDPSSVRNIWSKERGRHRLTPLSNMAAPDLSRLLTGRYFVFQTQGEGDFWSVAYMDGDGKTHFCAGSRNGSYREYVLDRYVIRTTFGLAGYMHWNSRSGRTPQPDLANEFSWPFVAESSTGRVASYFWSRNSWLRYSGWVQDDYAAAFAEKCPRLPRVGRVNESQTGSTIQEIARGASPIRGFTTAFENSVDDPLTAEVFYRNMGTQLRN